MGKNKKVWFVALAVVLGLTVLAAFPVIAQTHDAPVAAGGDGHAWWFWPLLLLITTFVISVVHHRHLGSLDLHEQGLRHSPDGGALFGGHYAWILCGGPAFKDCQAHFHPMDGHSHSGLCRA